MINNTNNLVLKTQRNADWSTLWPDALWPDATTKT